MTATRRLQLQLPLPFGREARDDERVQQQLSAGWRIAQIQRLTDKEVLITFEAVSP